MNAKLLICSLSLLLIVSSCNRRYSSRQYIKSGGGEVAVIDAPNEEEESEILAEVNEEIEMNFPEELHETDSIANAVEISGFPFELNENLQNRDVVENIDKQESRVFKNKQNRHPDEARPDDEPNKSKKGLAVASLVLGILSLIMLFVFPLFALVLGIVAVIFGAISLKDPNARGMAIAGLVTGLVTLLLFFFIILLVLALFL